MHYSNKIIASMYGYSVRTTQRHISALRREGKFKKTSKGKFYNAQDALQLAQLLNFSLLDSFKLVNTMSQHDKITTHPATPRQ